MPRESEPSNFGDVRPSHCLIRLSLIAALGFVTFGRADPESSLPDARTLFEARRYAEAQSAFEALNETDPANPEVLKFLGKLAAKRQDRVAALGYLKQALDQSPQDAELHFEYGAACGLYAASIGTSLTALRHAYKARQHLRNAIEMAPTNTTFRQGLIEFCLSAPPWVGGGIDAALEQAEEIARYDAAKGAFARATIQRADGNHTAALETLSSLIELAPDNYFALFQFGRCAAESGQRLEEGLAYLKRCLDLPAPDQAAPPAEVWWNIATIEKRRDNREHAIAALKQAAALAPRHQQIARDLESYLAEEA
ncbi:MAG: hypothetical protein SynsKO_43640 [Synoicihabitans sp.]